MKKILLALIVGITLIFISVPAFAANNITLTERNIFFFVDKGRLGIQDTIKYENPQGENLNIIVPKGADGIQGGTVKGAISLKKEDIKETDEGMELTIPIPKGNDFLEIVYFLKPTANAFNYTTKNLSPVKKMTFMSNGDTFVTGPTIAKPEKAKTGNWYVFNVNALNVGDIIEAKGEINPAALDPNQKQPAAEQPTDQQQTAAQGTQQQTENALSQPYAPQFHNPGHIRLWNTSAFSAIDPHVFTAVVVMIPIIFIVYYIRQRRKEKMLETVDVEEIAFQKLFNKEQDLLKKIAELDDKHQNGEIEEEEYVTLRENYKYRVMQIKAHLIKLSE